MVSGSRVRQSASSAWGRSAKRSRSGCAAGAPMSSITISHASPAATKSGSQSAGARDELLAQADIVVLALPLTPTTLHMLDSARLARMKPGSFLINPCRGSVVDEAAVLDALQSGRLAADVFESEDWVRADRPLEIAAGLRGHANTLFTAHIGSAVQRVRLAIELRAAQNICQALAGARPVDAVNEVAAARRAAC